MKDISEWRARVSATLHRLARTQRNMPVPLTEQEHTDLREAAYFIEGRGPFTPVVEPLELLKRYLDNHCANADAEGMSALCECKLCLDTRAILTTGRAAQTTLKLRADHDQGRTCANCGQSIHTHWHVVQELCPIGGGRAAQTGETTK